MFTADFLISLYLLNPVTAQDTESSAGEATNLVLILSVSFHFHIYCVKQKLIGSYFTSQLPEAA